MIKLSSQTLAKTGTKIEQSLLESGRSVKRIVYGKNTKMTKMGIGQVSKHELSDGAFQINYRGLDAKELFWYDRQADRTVKNVVLSGEKINALDGLPENKFVRYMLDLLKRTHLS